MASPSTTPPPSIFSDPDTDPRGDAALSPILWLPLTFLTVVCVLFVSLRRAHALQLYGRAREWLQLHLPFLPFLASSHYPPAGSIRLSPHDLEAALGAGAGSGEEGDSDGESSDGDEFHRGGRVGVDTSDELPTGFGRRSAWSVAGQAGGKMKQLAGGAIQTLGWGGDRPARGGARGDRDPGIASAFWGTRKADRIGGIRLGGGETSSRRAPGAGRGGLSGFSGLLERVTDVAGSRVPPSHTSAPYSALPPSPTSSRRAPPSPSASHGRFPSDGGLFELGEEDEEGHADAVELPHEFQLQEQPLAR